MSLKRFLEQAKTLPLKEGYTNVEIEAKFIRFNDWDNRVVDNLVAHLTKTKDIGQPVETTSVDFYFAGRSSLNMPDALLQTGEDDPVHQRNIR